MQKVYQKQEGTEEMFHRRQASLKKLAAKQTRPVQPVAPRPEALTKSPCPSPGVHSHHPSRPWWALTQFVNELLSAQGQCVPSGWGREGVAHGLGHPLAVQGLFPS